jgi:DNA-binding NarL/FixJ family response regulator
MRQTDGERRARVALVNDYELVLRGLAGMLAPFADRIDVIELDVNQNPDSPVDVALFDTYGNARLGLDRVASLASDPHVGKVAVYTWTLTAEQLDAATSAGAQGVIAKSTPAEGLVTAIEEIAEGKEFVSPAFGRLVVQPWPGHDFGLTLRESDVAVFLAEGLTNRDIAKAVWVSENTVKSHLKAIYRKAEVTSRGQAIARLLADPGFRRKSAEHRSRSA